MALKPCRECGANVSTEAKICPHCGVRSPTRPIADLLKADTESVQKPNRGRRSPAANVFLLALGAIAIYALAQEANKPKPPPGPPSCKKDWHLCVDNADMANNWDNWSHVQVGCKIAAEKEARYGDGPEWPWLSFSTFLKGDDYPKTGVVTAIENDAKFVNAFNAKVRTKVTCTYDLNANKVTNIVAIGH